MPNLYEILADAQQGEAMTALGNEFGLTPAREAAVAALLPAVSMGLKQSTATPEGLGNLLASMAQQPKLELYAVYGCNLGPSLPKGRAAGNAALSTMFGSPDASRAIAAKTQNLSGVISHFEEASADHRWSRRLILRLGGVGCKSAACLGMSIS